MPYKYAYFLGLVCILFPIWLFLLWRRKDLRREILTISLLLAIASPIADIVYIRDYWRPETFFPLFTFNGWTLPVIEDFLFGLFWGGIACSLYEEVYQKRFSKKQKTARKILATIIPVLIMFLAIGLLLPLLLPINSMHAGIIAFVAIALYMVHIRRDLLPDAFFSGILFAVVYLAGYLMYLRFFPLTVGKWYLMQNISGYLFWGVPVEEPMYAFGWGLVVGPVYEFATGKKLLGRR